MHIINFVIIFHFSLLTLTSFKRYTWSQSSCSPICTRSSFLLNTCPRTTSRSFCIKFSGVSSTCTRPKSSTGTLNPATSLWIQIVCSRSATLDWPGKWKIREGPGVTSSADFRAGPKQSLLCSEIASLSKTRQKNFYFWNMVWFQWSFLTGINLFNFLPRISWSTT